MEAEISKDDFCEFQPLARRFLSEKYEFVKEREFINFVLI